MSKRAQSIQWRILARQLPLLAILFFAVLLWFGERLRGLLYEADLEVARQSSRLTVAAVEARMESERAHRAWSRTLDEIPVREGSLVEVISARGEVLFATDSSLVGTTYRLGDSPCVVCHVGGSPRAETARAEIRGEGEKPYQVFAAPLRNTAACRRCHEEPAKKLGMVYVHHSLEPLNRQVSTIQLEITLAGLAALLLAVFTTRVLLGRYLDRPLRILAKGAREIGEGELDAPIELPERTELSLLAETLNRSAAHLRGMVETLARQRDESQVLYRLVDQLSRAVRPESRRRECVRLASEILRKDCALVQTGPGGGRVTFRGAEGGVTEAPLAEVPLPPFFDRELVRRWAAGDFAGQLEIRKGPAVAYPIRRGEQELGLLLTPAGDYTSPERAPDPGMVDALLAHLGIALAYSEFQQEVVERERLAAIGETVASLAHCLKNLLNGLRAGVYITDRGRELKDEKKLRDGWRVLTNTIAQVENLTFDMLYYIKQRTPHRETIDVGEILGKVKSVLDPEAERQGIEIRIEADSDGPPVLLDRTAVFRAILDLATNAVDACSESETGDLVLLQSRVEEGDLVLTVTDNGIGMPEEVQSKLFTRFFSTKLSRGTGLGLPVVRKIAEEHGGSLTFESEVNRGSTFVIRLPIP